MRTRSGSRARVVILGPALAALSGVSTHVNMLLGSDLGQHFELLHFQVGSEGRTENVIEILIRLCVSPFQLAVFLLKSRFDTVKLNTSLNAKVY
jgi:hypothetical protein